MKIKQKRQTAEKIITSYDILGFIPLLKISVADDLTIYRIFGLPLWIVRCFADIATNSLNICYYFLGIPLLELDSELNKNEKDAKSFNSGDE